MSAPAEVLSPVDQLSRAPGPDASPLRTSSYASPLPAGTRLQEFEISSVIGQGGFGIVYLARDLALQRSVAIKEYMPAHLAGRDAAGAVRPLTAGQSDVFELGRRSFINEARMLARFKHPGLLEVLRFWEQNGTAYMAMPYYDGATLTQYLKRHPGMVTEEWLKRTLQPLIDALGHMHEEDYFHRDVAPDNILILKDGSAVLLDLGAARRVIANDAQAMTVMLKPGYAPIEQYSDDPRFRQGPWTDIYAMAAVFFFGVTGKAPPASASRVMRDSVSPLSNVRPEGFSDSFLRAIDHGLSLQPEDRPRSIAEFRSLLYTPSAPQPNIQQQAVTKPAPKAIDGPAPAGVDDPFAPPTSGDGMPTLLAGGLAVLAVVLAAGWYVTKPAPAPTDTPAEIEAVLALPATAAPNKVEPGVTSPSTAPSTASDTSDTSDTSAASATSAEPAVAAPPNASRSADPADREAKPATVPEPDAPPVKPANKAASPARPADAAKNPVKPAAESAREAKPGTATAGTLVLAVKPWAEVRVNGVLKGISPPLKQLTLPSGRHTIEFRNPASAPVKKQVEVRANQQTIVGQQF